MKDKNENQSELSRVAEENADTARLDWFIHEGARLLKSGSRGWACQFGTRVIYGNSPREAIDAARGAEKPETLGSETPPAREQLNAETGLAPCPFCGNSLLEEHDDPKLTAIVCGQCGGQLHSGVSLKYAKDRWNKRAPLTATNKEDLGDATRTAQGLQSAETGDVINAARAMCEQYQLLFSIVSDISAFKDVDWEQDDHEKAIQRFSRALAKLDVPPTSSPPQSPTLTEGKEKSVWIRTSERAPTEKDVGAHELVLAWERDEGCPEEVDYHSIIAAPHLWPFWMPIPALPTKEQ